MCNLTESSNGWTESPKIVNTRINLTTGKKYWLGNSKENAKRYIQTNLTSGRINCNDCNVIFRTIGDKNKHIKSIKHRVKIGEIPDPKKKIKTKKITPKVKQSLRCHICKYTYSTKQVYNLHLNKERHITNLKNKEVQNDNKEVQNDNKEVQNDNKEVQTANYASDRDNKYCQVCDYEYKSTQIYKRHLLKSLHLRKVIKAEKDKQNLIN